MIQFFLDFIKFNSEVQYAPIITCVVIYLMILWGIVSNWVYKDAKKRYIGKKTPLMIAIGNFVLNIPFLIIYFLTRPGLLNEYDEWLDGGVNVPVVNFLGEKGIEMSLELRIFPKKLNNDKPGEMKIDVSFDSMDENKKIMPVLNSEGIEKSSESSGIIHKIKTTFAGLGSKIKKPSNNTVTQQIVFENPVENSNNKKKNKGKHKRK